MNNNNNN